MRARIKRHASVSERGVDDDWRCRSCDGVCCRSFVAVPLTFAEYEALRALGARRLELSLRGPHFLLIENGCEFLVNDRCGVYEHRPEACRRFICDDVAGCAEPPFDRAGARAP